MTFKNRRPIAILLAAYNAERFLAEQIDSVLAQSNREWTLYIRDDGSTDGTARIVADYTARYPDRIEAVDAKGPNLGCRGNFFRLLEAVESDYYMFCDADDVWLPEKVDVLYDALKRLTAAHPDRPVLAHTDRSVVDGDLKMICRESWSARGFHPERFYSYNLIAIVSPVGGADSGFNHAVKRLLFPLADNTLMHDRWLPMVVARHKGVIEGIPRTTRLYRQHGGNLYGMAVRSEGRLLSRMKQHYRNFMFTARKLRAAGYGSYGKILYFRIVAEIKQRF